MSNYDQFVCMSGLPRSGSTLLSAILSQNPKIHAEGNSAVCQLMWDVKASYMQNCGEQINSNNREHTIKEIISKIPDIYYNKIDESERIIVDKCRSWSLPANMELLKTHINKDIKVIMLERPIADIVKSFCKLHKQNNNIIELDKYLQEGSEPIMRSLHGLIYAKMNNQDNNYLFVTYDDLVSSTETVMDRIYSFCGWEPFEHNFDSVIPKYKENDSYYGLNGFHDVRPKIERVVNDTILPPQIMERCMQIDQMRLSTV
jgi:sulfotransferase